MTPARTGGIKRNTDLPARALAPALGRGLACRCPACGEGKLFRAYLKVNDACPGCGEALHHHRADDAPPYLVIFIVGHLIVGLMVYVDMAFSFPPLIYLSMLLLLAVALSLTTLPSVKGAVVALQWAYYMHGFDPGHRAGDDV